MEIDLTQETNKISPEWTKKCLVKFQVMGFKEQPQYSNTMVSLKVLEGDNKDRILKKYIAERSPAFAAQMAMAFYTQEELKEKRNKIETTELAGKAVGHKIEATVDPWVNKDGNRIYNLKNIRDLGSSSTPNWDSEKEFASADAITAIDPSTLDARTFSEDL